MRLAVSLLLLAVSALAGAAEPPTLSTIAIRELASPAPAGASGVSLTHPSQGGSIVLSWIETSPGPRGSGAERVNAASSHAATELHFARFDATARQWSPPRRVAVATNADTALGCAPVVVQAGGRLVVLWQPSDRSTWWAASLDGLKWSQPARWAPPEVRVDKFAAVTLADGRTAAMAVERGADGRTVLVARVLTAAGSGVWSESRVTESVSNSTVSLVSFLDGGALVAYRGAEDDNTRDICTARLTAKGSWTEPRRLVADGWQIQSPPADGPSLSTDGSRVAAAWFTAADGERRVLASYSPDAGTRWLMPLRVDLGHPAGPAETILLRDGAVLVFWVEQDRSVWLRRISPEFNATDAVLVMNPGEASLQYGPRAVLARDYQGGSSPATLILACPEDSPRAGVRLMTVEIPEGSLLTAERHCDCAPTPDQLVGFSMRGKILRLDADHRTVTIAHGEIPGVMAAGTDAFAVAPGEIDPSQTGRIFLGRIRRENDRWHLFDVRLLTTP
jgi:hypothetical protein